LEAHRLRAVAHAFEGEHGPKIGAAHTSVARARDDTARLRRR
jgi:hypothetical protein